VTREITIMCFKLSSLGGKPIYPCMEADANHPVKQCRSEGDGTVG
jgi:hypothetical protein